MFLVILATKNLNITKERTNLILSHALSITYYSWQGAIKEKVKGSLLSGYVISQPTYRIRTRDPHLGKVMFYHWTTFAMPATWLEHATLWLQIRCSTNWAKPAHYYSLMRVKGLEPPRRKAPDPKSGASANSAKPAKYDPYWARTSDPLIKSQLLYQLS